MAGRHGHYRPQRTKDDRLEIGQLSWTGDGRELVYLGLWSCMPFRSAKHCVSPGPKDGTEEVRTLTRAAGGGRLDSGRVLLRQSIGETDSAVISPDGSALTVGAHG